MTNRIANKLRGLAFGAALVSATFSAGADDIDIFTGASAGANANPRILIVLDNTANWSGNDQHFPEEMQGQAEVSAISTVLGDVDGTVSVGIMEFVTGQGKLDGGFIRSAIKPMNAANKSALQSQLAFMHSNINDPDEKQNSGLPYGTLMYDVYNYFAGANATSPSAVLPSKADTAGYTSPFTRFATPLTADNTCGKSFVIFISNPQSSGPKADSPANTTALNQANNNRDANGNLIPVTQLPLPNINSKTMQPTGTSSTDTAPFNADEWARLLRERGVPVQGSSVSASVTTYTIDVFNAQQSAKNTSLMMSMAKAGGGKYFAATNKQQIIDALKEIIIEIQAVNSSFASTSLPVNATNRAQNENQVFIGMFRPDTDARPRWFGNLKRFQLVKSGSNIDLGDVNGKLAINPLTGFVTPCATSYWTFDSGTYWANSGVSPDPAGTCATTSFSKYSDAPDGPFVEKGAVAEILRMGNVAAGTAQAQAVNRKMLTLQDGQLVDFTAASSGLDANLVKYIRGEDVNNEKGTGQLTTTRPSIHGDVIHSRPLPLNYGARGITVYYGANDGTLRAVDAATGVERWSFVAPEFFPRLARLKDNLPRVAYPNLPETITATPKDYFFDGSSGVYQDAANADVWIYPSMRRGGRMIYAIKVTDPDQPEFKWRAGCPNLTNDDGCTDERMKKIGQTWSTPSVALIKGYGSGAKPVVAFGGGYDSCEDEDTKAPSRCVAGSEKGGMIYILDAKAGTILYTFATDRAVAADVAFVDIDNDSKPDYLYAVDTGGAVYRVDFIDGPDTRAPLAEDAWTGRKVARTRSDAGRKFLFAPAVFATRAHAYLAVGSGDREHPLYAHYPYETVTNRFYVYKDDLSVRTGDPRNLDSDTRMKDYTANTDCSSTPILPGTNDFDGWFMDLAKGEQVVTSALIAGGMVTFSTNRPIPPAVGTCSTALGEARGYWVNLLNGSGAIGVRGTCGGQRSSPFVGGGLPPSPVIANSVPVGDSVVTAVIGAVQRNSDGTGGANGQFSPQELQLGIGKQRRRAYSYTSGD